ncbi:reverse transcriptase domain-containing protein [Tanacetum coccineum]
MQPPIVTTVTKTTNKEKAPDAAPRVNIQDLCEEHYEYILPIIMEKAQRDKQKEIQTRLNFENFKKSQRERENTLNSRAENSPARFHPESSRIRGRERCDDKNMFNRLSHRRRSVHERLTDTYSPSTTKSEPSRTDLRDPSHSKGHSRRHWKSGTKRHKLADEDDLAKPWTCEDVDPFTPQIQNFKSSRKTRMPNNVKTYDGTGDPEDHLKIFQAAAQRPLAYSDGTEGPLVIAGKIGGHMIHHMYIDGGSSTEILYEHCFNELRSEIKSQMVPARTSLIGFSRETIWLLGQLRLLVTIRDADHCTKAWMDFMIVISISPYNGIIGRPGIREIQAVPSTAHGMLKFPADGGIVTIRSTILIPAKYAMVITLPKEIPKEAGVRSENLKVSIHPNFPDQEVAIRGTLSLEGCTELCTLLKKNLDIFAWQPSNMIGVPRSIAEHRLNIREGYSPVRQKKRGQAPERVKAIQAEVQN